jgi:putative transposase
MYGSWVILTFKFRVKDSSAKRHLNRMAIACNQVWNFCASTQREAERRRNGGANTQWPSAFDLITLCVGVTAELGIHSDTVSEICRRFVVSRNQHKRCPRFRASFGGKRALGWLPFRGRSIKLDGDSITYLKRGFRFWKSRDVRGELKTGAFVQDARGRWYVTFQCEVDEQLPTGPGQIGIDLGLKTLATCSNGLVIPALQHYRQYERALAKTQRAGNKRRVRAIHAKIANARHHHLHEWSTKIARENELIVVGNVSPSRLAKTKMAKSIIDASWAMLKNQLRYKASRHGARYLEVDERLTTQACSDCGAVGGPKGIAGLGIRHWSCPSCGSIHDRDSNAARNILRAGAERRPPAEGIAA